MTAQQSQPTGLHTALVELPVRGRLPAFDSATAWINTPPLTAAGLRGKVVVVNFWTYTCVNWLRQLPYLRAWHRTYGDAGLVLVGVHTPEFTFETDTGNVRRAVRQLEIDYPVAVDSDYGVWGDFDNRYWPALYFADASGRVRHHHFGEGEYRQSEMVIRQLLGVAGSGVPAAVSPTVASSVEAAADWHNLRTPETYLGYQRLWNFASAGGAVLGERHDYTRPAVLHLNQWALSGEWSMGHEAAVSRATNARVSYRFHARDVNLVMGPSVYPPPVPFRVLVDGRPPGSDAGSDVDADGNGTLAEQRLYQLVRQTGPISDRTVEVTFADPGAEIYAFTFG
ncbi:redoxin domain-containing protein [Kribbella sp. NPDC049174]|uniref:redoxin domain-containing protein n=1 Tax=Kribbella sp. NPDC049174 TaxID=3364112 RepID=UPI0037139888